MYSFVLQDWLTISGPDANTIIQTERDWLDMSPYQDVVSWVDVKEVGATAVNLLLETAPSKDESLFQAMGAATPMTVGLTIVQLLMGSATVPIAQYLRWKIGPASAAAWEVTFRILVAANAPGLQLTDTNTPFLLPPEL